MVGWVGERTDAHTDILAHDRLADPDCRKDIILKVRRHTVGAGEWGVGGDGRSWGGARALRSSTLTDMSTRPFNKI